MGSGSKPGTEPGTEPGSEPGLDEPRPGRATTPRGPRRPPRTCSFSASHSACCSISDSTRPPDKVEWPSVCARSRHRCRVRRRLSCRSWRSHRRSPAVTAEDARPSVEPAVCPRVPPPPPPSTPPPRSARLSHAALSRWCSLKVASNASSCCRACRACRSITSSCSSRSASSSACWSLSD